jgi:CO/xanthine dehydrogenase FAD-binding subunit
LPATPWAAIPGGCPIGDGKGIGRADDRERGAETDIKTVTELAPAPGSTWRDGDAFLAGGTWLFSEPQPGTTRLLDLTGFGWPSLTETGDGLEIAATCTLAELARWRPAPGHDWPAATLPRQCTDALLGSFKVHNVATVGGNICLSLPAGPMISLAAALDGTAAIWAGDGMRRQVPVMDFVTGDRANVLRPGELLRSVFLPARALRAAAACRQASLSPVGRSAVLLIGTRAPADAGGAGGDSRTVLTLTAAVSRPVQVTFKGFPQLNEAIDSVDSSAAATGYLDDVHGSARWRRAMTRRAVAEVITELAR